MTDFSLTGPANVATMSKALPDEPAFIILGRDPDGAFIVNQWAERREAAGDPEHAQSVYPIAEAMSAWAKEHRPQTAPPASRYEEAETYRRRLRLDIDEIWRSQDRTGRKAEQNFRWEGMPANPNGWRKMGDHARDLELLLNVTRGTPVPEWVEERERMLDLLEDCLAMLTDPNRSQVRDREDYENMVIRIEEFTDGREHPTPAAGQRLRGDESQLDGDPSPSA
jgi:hypothetical protein